MSFYLDGSFFRQAHSTEMTASKELVILWDMNEINTTDRFPLSRKKSTNQCNFRAIKFTFRYRKSMDFKEFCNS